MIIFQCFNCVATSGVVFRYHSNQHRVVFRLFTLVDNLKLSEFSFNKRLTCSAKAEITLPSVVRDLFILAPSFRRLPFAPVDSALSLPARSTRLIFET